MKTLIQNPAANRAAKESAPMKPSALVSSAAVSVIINLPLQFMGEVFGY